MTKRSRRAGLRRSAGSKEKRLATVGGRFIGMAPAIGLSGVAGLFGAAPGMAANECGPMGSGTTVICDVATYTGVGDGTEASPGQTTVNYSTATTSNAMLILNDLWLDSFDNGVFWDNNVAVAIVTAVTMNGGSITRRDDGTSRTGLRLRRRGGLQCR